MRLDDIDYALPAEAIAQTAIEPRDSSRLLVCDQYGDFGDSCFRDLTRLLRPGDLLVLNDTKVMNARVFARRSTGGKCEVLFLRPCMAEGLESYWEALIRASRRLADGELLVVDRDETRLGRSRPPVEIELGPSMDRGLRAVRVSGMEVRTFLEEYGNVPLPPYFKGRLGSPDRYQSVFAAVPASSAAPTASLHFTRDLLEKLARNGVTLTTITLEVGIDTFRPITVDDPQEHPIHEEVYEITPSAASAISRARQEGRNVIAVGTTVTRALEAAAVRDDDAVPTGNLRSGRWRTSLLISPGHNFYIDGLITNFHAPRSSLLLLLSALYPLWRQAYDHALASGYRFLSLGDAMLILPSGRRVERFSREVSEQCL